MKSSPDVNLVHNIVTFRGLIKFFFSISISLIVGWWAYLQSGSPEYQSIRISNWAMIPIICLLIIIGNGARSWRLSHLFHPSYGKFWQTFKVLFFSLSFSFLLGGIGFVIRLFFLRRGVGARHVVSLGLISVEKFFDLILAFIIAFFLFTVPDSENLIIRGINENRILILIPLLIFLVWFYYHQGKVFRCILAVIGKTFRTLSLPRRYYYFCKRQLFYLYKSLGSLPPRRIGFFIGHSGIVFAVESSFYYLGLQALGVEIVWTQALLLNAVILLALLIPIFPSGIGLFQAAMVFILGGSNMFYVSLLIHFLLIITNLIIVTLGSYQLFDYFKTSLGSSSPLKNSSSEKR